MPSSTRPTSLAVAVALLTLLVGSACGSSSDGSADAAPSEPTSSDTASGGSDAGDPAGNPGKETLSDAKGAADKTVTYTADQAWDPATLEVAPGEVFTFVAGEGAGSVAVTFDGSNSYTMSGGLTESFTLTTPGTYTVTEFISGTPMTITVAE